MRRADVRPRVRWPIRRRHKEERLARRGDISFADQANAVVAGVGDIEIVVCVERNSVGTAEQRRLRMVAVALIARRAALASDGTESAVVVNGADAVIEGVGEKDTAIGVNGDVAGPVERDISSWCAFIGCAARRWPSTARSLMVSV